MVYNMVDKKLYTFIKLCDVLNYRITAELLHMTQPAVTQHIQGLEREYNCKLFYYEGHNLKLSPSGDILLNYARSAIYNEQKLISSLPKSEKTVFRLGATKTIGDYVIDKKISHLINQDNLDFTLIIDNTERLLKMLNNSELDVALIEGFFDKLQYNSKLYKLEEFIGICSPIHPFSNKEIEFEQLFSEKLLIREVGSGTRAVIEQVLSQNNYSLENFKSMATISSFEIITKSVQENSGISFVYKSLAVKKPNLSTFKIKNTDIKREFNYVFLKDTSSVSYLNFI